MKRKIIILEDSGPAGFGGGQKVTMEVMRLAPPHAEILLIDSSSSAAFFAQASELAQASLSLNSRYFFEYGAGNNFALTIKSLWRKIVKLPIDLIRIARFLKQNRAQGDECTFYAPTKTGAVYGRLLSALWGGEFIFHAHNCYGTRSWLESLFTKYVISGADKVVAVSDYVASSLDLPAKTVRIYNPLTSSGGGEIARQFPEAGVIRIASCCSLIHYKGVEVFLDAAKLLASTPEQYEFVIIGDGPLKPDLQEKFSDYAHFLGAVIDVHEVLCGVDILVVPSIEPDAYSLVITEAFGCGIPVIATNLGAHPELVSDYQDGLLVEPDNPVAICAAIQSIVRDHEMATRMQSNALKKFEQFEQGSFGDDIWMTLLGAQRRELRE